MLNHSRAITSKELAPASSLASRFARFTSEGATFSANKELMLFTLEPFGGVYTSDNARQMEKSASLRIRLEPELHRSFLSVCNKLDVKASSVVRQCIRTFLEKHHNTTQSDLFRESLINSLC